MAYSKTDLAILSIIGVTIIVISYKKIKEYRERVADIKSVKYGTAIVCQDVKDKGGIDTLWRTESHRECKKVQTKEF